MQFVLLPYCIPLYDKYFPIAHNLILFAILTYKVQIRDWSEKWKNRPMQPKFPHLVTNLIPSNLFYYLLFTCFPSQSVYKYRDISNEAITSYYLEHRWRSLALQTMHFGETTGNETI